MSQVSDSTAGLDLSGLPPEAAEAAGRFFASVLETAADNILSITIVGSAVTPDYRPDVSDINSVLIVETVNMTLLESVASLGRKFGRKGIAAPILMTPEYIERSLDVFPLEFMEYRAAHMVAYGRDFFADLAFGKDDVRAACERQSKSLLMAAHQGYLLALNNAQRLRSLLFELSNSVLPVLRGLLYLAETEAPATRRGLLEAAAKRFDISWAAFESIIEMRDGNFSPTFGELQQAFEELYATIGTLSHVADRS